MKKKIYEKPSIKVIKIQQTHILCGSPDGAPDRWGGDDPDNPYDFD